jgi:hexosaminidase
MIFPRIAALAETQWTEKKNKDLKNFDERLLKQFELYRKERIHFCNPFDRDENGEPNSL